jgi:predicted MFS family arabinose efflux permease
VSVTRLLLVIFSARTLLNIGYRAVYPFLPFIAADLGVSFQSAAEIIQSRNLIALAAPLFGPLSDHYGRRTIMLAGLAVSLVACLTLGAFNSFLFAVIAIAIVSLGKALYDPAQQAYLGDRVPYAQRGRAISLSELSWSAASLLGLPSFGIVVQYAGWRAGFVGLGLLGIFVLGLTRVGLPGEAAGIRHSQVGLWGRTFGRVIHEPVALAVLLMATLNAASNENLNTVYGEWMQTSFHLDAIALGGVAAAIGLAELGGELVSSGWVDRIGKHRLVGVTLFCTAAAYALLPIFGHSVILGTTGLFLVYFLFEISVVSALSLISEVVPTARATLLSLNVGAFALGRTLGSFIGPFVFSNAGISGNGLASALGTLLAWLVWQLLVREREA